MSISSLVRPFAEIERTQNIVINQPGMSLLEI